MVRFATLRLESLAAKLGMAALFSFLAPALLSALLFLTAWSASEVVGAARTTHDRVSVYIQLENAAGDFQRLSYQLSSDTSEDARRQISQAKTRFENLLAEAGRLPQTNERDRTVRQLIQRQGQVALRHHLNSAEHVRGVDRAWRRGGSKAALEEVSRIAMPVKNLQTTLQAEIRRGDWITARETGDAMSLIDTAVNAALIGLVAAAMFFLLMQVLLQMRLRPGLQQLERGARAFGAGDLDHRIGLTGRDELARISGAFDNMAQTIAEKQDALNDIRHGLEQAVATSTRELRQANEELSAVDERRRAFLADISHELRTPLTVIRGEAQVALRLLDKADFDSQEVFERILKQTQDLSRMVADLFLIARAQAGGLPLELEMLDLRELAKGVACDFDTVAGIMGGSIHAEDGPPVFACVDHDRVRRALAALVENALRHCDTGVRIRLEVWEQGPNACIAVCDNGPGIDFAHAEELFERFRRGESRGEGSGLGLSLVSALVAAHGGHTKLLPAPGGGTRAILQFEIAKDQRIAA